MIPLLVPRTAEARNVALGSYRAKEIGEGFMIKGRPGSKGEKGNRLVRNPGPREGIGVVYVQVNPYAAR